MLPDDVWSFLGDKPIPEFTFSLQVTYMNLLDTLRSIWEQSPEKFYCQSNPHLSAPSGWSEAGSLTRGWQLIRPLHDGLAASLMSLASF